MVSAENMLFADAAADHEPTTTGCGDGSSRRTRRFIVRLLCGEELVNLPLLTLVTWTLRDLFGRILERIQQINRERGAQGERLLYTTVAFPNYFRSIFREDCDYVRRWTLHHDGRVDDHFDGGPFDSMERWTRLGDPSCETQSRHQYSADLAFGDLRHELESLVCPTKATFARVPPDFASIRLLWTGDVDDHSGHVFGDVLETLYEQAIPRVRQENAGRLLPLQNTRVLNDVLLCQTLSQVLLNLPLLGFPAEGETHEDQAGTADVEFSCYLDEVPRLLGGVSVPGGGVVVRDDKVSSSVANGYCSFVSGRMSRFSGGSYGLFDAEVEELKNGSTWGSTYGRFDFQKQLFMKIVSHDKACAISVARLLQRQAQTISGVRNVVVEITSKVEGKQNVCPDEVRCFWCTNGGANVSESCRCSSSLPVHPFVFREGERYLAGAGNFFANAVAFRRSPSLAVHPAELNQQLREDDDEFLSVTDKAAYLFSSGADAASVPSSLRTDVEEDEGSHTLPQGTISNTALTFLAPEKAAVVLLRLVWLSEIQADIICDRDRYPSYWHEFGCQPNPWITFFSADIEWMWILEAVWKCGLQPWYRVLEQLTRSLFQDQRRQVTTSAPSIAVTPHEDDPCAVVCSSCNWDFESLIAPRPDAPQRRLNEVDFQALECARLFYDDPNRNFAAEPFEVRRYICSAGCAKNHCVRWSGAQGTSADLLRWAAGLPSEDHFYYLQEERGGIAGHLRASGSKCEWTEPFYSIITSLTLVDGEGCSAGSAVEVPSAATAQDLAGALDVLHEPAEDVPSTLRACFDEWRELEASLRRRVSALERNIAQAMALKEGGEQARVLQLLAWWAWGRGAPVSGVTSIYAIRDCSVFHVNVCHHIMSRTCWRKHGFIVWFDLCSRGSIFQKTKIPPRWTKTTSDPQRRSLWKQISGEDFVEDVGVCFKDLALQKFDCAHRARKRERRKEVRCEERRSRVCRTRHIKQRKKKHSDELVR